MQPTGNLHLGNYLGAIKNWVELQKKFSCIFCIVDLHALTVPSNCKEIKKNTLEVTAAYLASGINPDSQIIFSQSSVYGHSDLAWILSCHTPIGWLNRMTQFKDKAGKNKEKAPLGLYSYPVLMAADILLYKATHVPVGDDQKQHLELSRDISQSFNRYYENEFFPLPEPIILESGARVMSLKDGENKMSKSDPSDNSRINLQDSSDLIYKKIQKSKTDSDPFPTSVVNLNDRPEISNLVGIYSTISKIPIEKVIDMYLEKSFSVFKKDLYEIVNNEIAVVSDKMNRLLDDETYLSKILRNGAEKASVIAERNLKEIREIIGFFK